MNWDGSLSFDIHMLIQALMFVVILGFPFVIFYKRRQAKAVYSKNSGREVEDPEALAQAEESVKDLDLLKSLHEKYIHIKSYQTINGHDQTTMTNLVVHLQIQGIASDFYFSQVFPAGYASITGGMGEYYLFVDPDKTEEAQQALAQYFKIK